ncbi:MAG TPA: 2-C-methyl-D-erythritol 2,4-cyclodiphosphate synthase [Phycisphaerae bacterium]|nr:2-C-methyl-D-erythritol 2,4-cyclodiphosphate synthase [Phycisphaerae bacterium]HOI56812.1 2-C-methyl-D-erythritol 2,4-cyclodiphosphate synthase [Phycisphaerae bacterium]
MKTVPRVGFGYDIHRLSSGRLLVLGGVRIESDRGLLGHSDGDAVLHALSDAIFGAIGSGDIGEHFPDNDPQTEGLDSRVILRTAVDEARAAGYAVRSVDITILAERPKLGPVKQEIRDSLADLLGLPVEAVGVKARTNEGLDAVGRREAIACHAVVVLA